MLRPLRHALRAGALHPSSRRETQRVFKRAACSCLASRAVVTGSCKPLAGAQHIHTHTALDPPTPQIDHRSIARDHSLFITSPFSPGSPLLLPNGAYVFHKLQAFLRAQYPQFGFEEVITPTMYKKSLWEQSGHWDNYADDMFSVQGRGASGDVGEAGEAGEAAIEAGADDEFGLKPMNCPGHCLLFDNDVKSYRDLPVRLADFSALHRNEISGALTGLTRVRRFHQDDAHIFCRPDQILAEIEQTLKFVGMVYKTFGLGSYKLLLSTRPKDSFIGTVQEWDQAELQLTTALNNTGSDWALNEGDGAFYGPKIDIILKDANGKDHQTATIQLDFQLPQRFGLQYQASPEEIQAGSRATMDAGLDPQYRRPVIVHRAIYGSIERFMALLIEHYAGKYPFWLSPRPAIVLSLNSDPQTLEYVARVQSELSGISPRPQPGLPPSADPQPLPLSTIHLPIDVDTSSRSLGKKIAEAKVKKYNHIVVVGGREAENEGVSVQISNQPNMESTVSVLRAVRGETNISKKETATTNYAMSLGVARKYFEQLANSYL